MNKENKEGLSPEFDTWLKANNPRNAMHAPEGYFDSFSDKLLAELPSETNGSKVVKFRSLYFGGSIAAGFAILLAVLFFMKNDQVSNDYYADLSEDLSWLYLIQNSTELSLAEIASLSEGDDEWAEMELEIFSNSLSDEFIDGLDFDLLEDLYE